MKRLVDYFLNSLMWIPQYVELAVVIFLVSFLVFGT